MLRYRFQYQRSLRIFLDTRQVDLSSPVVLVFQFFFVLFLAQRDSFPLVHTVWFFPGVASRRVPLLAGYLRGVESKREFVCDTGFRRDDSQLIIECSANNYTRWQRALDAREVCDKELERSVGVNLMYAGCKAYSMTYLHTRS